MFWSIALLAKSSTCCNNQGHSSCIQNACQRYFTFVSHMSEFVSVMCWVAKSVLAISAQQKTSVN